MLPQSTSEISDTYLYIMDTVWSPNGVLNREVPLYTVLADVEADTNVSKLTNQISHSCGLHVSCTVQY